MRIKRWAGWGLIATRQQKAEKNPNPASSEAPCYHVGPILKINAEESIMMVS
jgi:hypothetical protein